MSKLENIVPSLELCKKIPVGEFEDTALVWVYDMDGLEMVMPREVVQFKGIEIYPAPTLEETITSLLTYGWLVKIDCRFGLDTFVELYSRTSNKHYTEYDPSACAAALRLWLRVKGIEVE